MRFIILTAAAFFGPLLGITSAYEKPAVDSDRRSFVYHLQYTKAKEAARQLQARLMLQVQKETDKTIKPTLAIPEFAAKVTVDVEQNSLHVTTNRELENNVSRMVSSIDWKVGMKKKLSRVFRSAQQDWRIVTQDQQLLLDHWWRYGKPALSQREDDEIRMLRTLQKRVSWRFQRVSLRKVIDNISSKHGFAAVLDLKGLKDMKLLSTSVISSSVKKEPLWSALRQLLNANKLGFTIEGNALKISSLTRLKSARTLKIYPVADIVTTFEQGVIEIDFEEIAKEIKHGATSPTSILTWDHIKRIEPELCLAIRHTENGHKEIEIVLSNIRSSRNQPLQLFFHSGFNR